MLSIVALTDALSPILSEYTNKYAFFIKERLSVLPSSVGSLLSFTLLFY